MKSNFKMCLYDEVLRKQKGNTKFLTTDVQLTNSQEHSKKCLKSSKHKDTLRIIKKDKARLL